MEDEYTDNYVDQLKAEITSLKAELFKKDRYYISILSEYEKRLKEDEDKLNAKDKA